MSSDKTRASLRVAHIREEIAFLRGQLQNTTALAVIADPLRRRAVERSLQIICEAVRHIPEPWTARFPNVEWRSIRDMGNRLRHEYHRLDQNILVEILDFELDAIEEACETLQDVLNLPR